jgi:hypothetical protein
MNGLILLLTLVCPQAGAADTVKPVFESRFGVLGTRLDNSSGVRPGDELGLTFKSGRNLFGVDVQVQPNLRGKVGMSVKVPTQAGEQANTFLHTAFIDVDVIPEDRLTVRMGMQRTNFGARGYFISPTGPYHLVGPNPQELALIAGMVQPRDLGVRAMGDIVKGRASWDVMVFNGTGFMAPEDNRAKDVSARLSTDIGERFILTGSGQRHVDGVDGDRIDWAWSTMAEWRLENVRMMAEYLGGRIGPESSEVLIGGQSAVALDIPVSAGSIERWSMIGRWGHFDPHAATQDADSWMLFDGSVQQWWETDSVLSIRSGLGYSVWMPMDLTEPVEHAALLELLVHR